MSSIADEEESMRPGRKETVKVNAINSFETLNTSSVQSINPTFLDDIPVLLILVLDTCRGSSLSSMRNGERR